MLISEANWYVHDAPNHSRGDMGEEVTLILGGEQMRIIA